MDETAILAELSRVLAEVLDDATVSLTMTTERADVPGWDSFAYINFIVGVESAFGVKFKVAEVESFPDVGAIVRALIARGAAAKGA